MSLPDIPVRDYRRGGLAAYASDHAAAAAALMDAIIAGFGPLGSGGRHLLHIADRIAARRLEALGDPYRDEVLALRRLVGRPGPVAFSLSYEFGCTARIFEQAGGRGRVISRTLDWPFRGLGDRVEILLLPGAAGDWITATWPGVVGALHGAAPGRFAAALNQAPEPSLRGGRALSWLAAKRRFLRAMGMPPAHLLRQAFEQAADFDAARRMLAEAPVAVPVIYTLAGPGRGEACVIERTEDAARVAPVEAAANHFTTDVGGRLRWRARGYDSPGRLDAACALAAPPAPDAIEPPILNALTRLAMLLETDGVLSVAGYEGVERVTGCATARVDPGPAFSAR